MSWLEEWHESAGVRLFLAPLESELQNYALESAPPKTRSREKATVQRFLGEYYPNLLITKDDYGKPYFPQEKIHFNYSHSTTHFLWGEHHEFPVGVDVECERPQLQRVAHKFCNEHEWAFTQNGTHIPMLLAIWSAKESMFKAYGKGEIDFKLDLSLEAFELQEKGEIQAHFGANQDRRLTIYYRRFNSSICTWTLWR